MVVNETPVLRPMRKLSILSKPKKEATKQHHLPVLEEQQQDHLFPKVRGELETQINNMFKMLHYS